MKVIQYLFIWIVLFFTGCAKHFSTTPTFKQWEQKYQGFCSEAAKKNVLSKFTISGGENSSLKYSNQNSNTSFNELIATQYEEKCKALTANLNEIRTTSSYKEKSYVVINWGKYPLTTQHSAKPPASLLKGLESSPFANSIFNNKNSRYSKNIDYSLLNANQANAFFLPASTKKICSVYFHEKKSYRRSKRVDISSNLRKINKENATLCKQYMDNAPARYQQWKKQWETFFSFQKYIDTIGFHGKSTKGVNKANKKKKKNTMASKYRKCVQQVNRITRYRNSSYYKSMAMKRCSQQFKRRSYRKKASSGVDFEKRFSKQDTHLKKVANRLAALSTQLDRYRKAEYERFTSSHFANCKLHKKNGDIITYNDLLSKGISSCSQVSKPAWSKRAVELATTKEQKDAVLTLSREAPKIQSALAKSQKKIKGKVQKEIRRQEKIAEREKKAAAKRAREYSKRKRKNDCALLYNGFARRYGANRSYFMKCCPQNFERFRSGMMLVKHCTR